MRKFLQSLQSRLILLLILVALPGLIGLIYYSIVDRAHAIKAAQQQAVNTVNITTANQALLIENTHYFLHVLSSFKPVLNPNSPECSSFLSQILRLNDNYINLGVPRLDGELICNAHPLKKPVNVADRPYIQEALTTKDFSISNFQVDRFAGVTSINFAYPVINPVTHKTVGLVVAVVSLDWWGKFLSESSLPENSVAYITDNENKIIATYPTNTELLGSHLKEVQGKVIENDVSYSKGTEVILSADEYQRIFVSGPLFKIKEDANINICVGIPLDKQFSSINLRLMKMILFLLFFMALMFAIAIWGIRKSVLIPLKTLLQSTKNLELGVSSRNLPTQGSSEFIELQQHFKTMATTRLSSEKLLKKSQISLQKSQNKLSLHIENTPLGCVSWDKNFVCTEWNKSAENIFGYRENEAIGRHATDLLFASKFHSEINATYASLLKKKSWTFIYENVTKDGRTIICEWHTTVLKAKDDSINGVTSLVQDITEIKKHQFQLEHMAHYDMLTDLPNRTLLAEILNQAITKSKLTKQPLAVAFLDLDGFKAVNDKFGHKFGDELIIVLARRIEKVLCNGEVLSRFGGDEFAAVLTNFSVKDNLLTILGDLLKAASDPITVLDTTLSISASIGVTLYPSDNSDADQLIRHADQAMYIAKQKGKNRYHLFDIKSEDAIKNRVENIRQVNAAIDNSEFVLYYQPKVNMRTGDVIGVEALIRWRHPEQGLIPPIEFLPFIEGHSICLKMGEWVINEALNQILKWKTQGLTLPVSVNIGALQLQQKDFAERLSMLLAAYPEVSPSLLQLEVLETSALGNVMDASEIMNSCVKLGVTFAIDDFGTGYSSLTYLRRLPAQMIKIDQTFVFNMLTDAEDWAIVAGVIALAKSFDRSVIAEGVESTEHGTALLRLGCELAQGYGIARPMPAVQIPKWVQNWRPDIDW